MIKLTESAIEDFAIEHFEALGYHYIYGPDIAPDSEILELSRWNKVFYNVINKVMGL